MVMVMVTAPIFFWFIYHAGAGPEFRDSLVGHQRQPVGRGQVLQKHERRVPNLKRRRGTRSEKTKKESRGDATNEVCTSAVVGHAPFESKRHTHPPGP